jgi:hypothetical protein
MNHRCSACNAAEGTPHAADCPLARASTRVYHHHACPYHRTGNVDDCKCKPIAGRPPGRMPTEPSAWQHMWLTIAVAASVTVIMAFAFQSGRLYERLVISGGIHGR